jgi:hypothetical protein
MSEFAHLIQPIAILIGVLGLVAMLVGLVVSQTSH